MRDRDLYARILGIESPWQVTNVDLRLNEGEVVVSVIFGLDEAHVCPQCGSSGPGYDSRPKRWRHLDTCQYRTILEANVPRMTCPEHGVVQVAVPWAEPGSRFTALFEALVIDWLRETTILAVARQLGLSWTSVSHIMERAVKRGLDRRERAPAKHLGIDETAFRKRHDYVTVISDSATGVVLHVAQDRRKASVEAWFAALDDASVTAIESVSMDMWSPYIEATLAQVPDAERKIAFDKFHVAKHLGEAVDRVRRQENRALIEQGSDALKGTKYRWLKNRANMSRREAKAFESLRKGINQTSRAWAIKELGMSLWHYDVRGWAAKAWQKWYSWAIRSRLKPIRRVARMIKTHLWGILNAIVLKVTNASAESLNSRIKMVKVKSRGFRNKERFANAIYFHLGGLDLYPTGVR